VSLYDPELVMGARLERVLRDVGSERLRQDVLKAQGRFEHTPADPEVNHYERLAMLAEEVGEVAKETLGQAEGKLAHDNDVDRASLRKELIQVAAVAVAWIEALDRGAP
jgi:NTP pyrophosphatase (non-canonical NTP hydrolase)